MVKNLLTLTKKVKQLQLLLSVFLLAILANSSVLLAQNNAPINAVAKIFSFGGIFLYSQEFSDENYAYNYLIPTELIAHGSGVFINNDGLLVTAKHVIQPSIFNLAILPGESQTFYPLFVIAADEQSDFAFCKINKKVKEQIPLPPSKIMYDYGIKVTAIGYPIDPLAERPTISRGEITSWSSEKLQINAPITGGFSGGAVINSKTNDLLGIISARYVGNEINMGWIVPIEMVKTFYNRNVKSRVNDINSILRELTPNQRKCINQFGKLVFYLKTGDEERYTKALESINLNDFSDFPELHAAIRTIAIYHKWAIFTASLGENTISYDEDFEWANSINDKLGENAYKDFLAYYGDMINDAMIAVENNPNIVTPKTFKFDNGLETVNIVYYLLYKYNQLKESQGGDQ